MGLGRESEAAARECDGRLEGGRVRELREMGGREELMRKMLGGVGGGEEMFWAGWRGRVHELREMLGKGG